MQSFHVAGSKSRIEAWSKIRLPFEPKGDLLAFRTDIRQGLRVMEMPAGEVLHAVYRSLCEDLVDTENVLFYNVGTSHFAHLVNVGIRFERAFVQPPPVSGIPICLPKHHNCYEAADAQAGFAHWRRGRTLATWTDAVCGPFTSNSKPAQAWLGVKRVAKVTTPLPDQPPQRYGLSVCLRLGAKDRNIHVASIVKPLLIVGGMLLPLKP
ncbi:MAG TPA: hypothetical protein VGP33_04380, partial [Chloroflexota bacterium]|nr:hypothetical protein [Chloroflexota bacterium]